MSTDFIRFAVRQIFEALKRDKLITHSVDSIAYTEDFNKLFAIVRKEYPTLGLNESLEAQHQVYMALMNLRKGGKARAPR